MVRSCWRRGPASRNGRSGVGRGGGGALVEIVIAAARTRWRRHSGRCEQMLRGAMRGVKNGCVYVWEIVDHSKVVCIGESNVKEDRVLEL